MSPRTRRTIIAVISASPKDFLDYMADRLHADHRQKVTKDRMISTEGTEFFDARDAERLRGMVIHGYEVTERARQRKDIDEVIQQARVCAI